MSQAWVRWVLAVVVVVVLGGTIVGIDPGSGGDDGEAPQAPSTAARRGLVQLGPVADRGRKVFGDQGCGGCHQLADAKSQGRIGPDLDRAISKDDLAAIREDVVDPGAQSTPGYPSGRMPDGYGDRLSPQQLDDLVRYLQAATSGR